MGPAMENRRSEEEGNDMGHLAVGRVARTAPRRIPRRHIARRGQPPRACPEASSLFPSRRAVECPSGARAGAAVGSSPWSRRSGSTRPAILAPSKPAGPVGVKWWPCASVRQTYARTGGSPAARCKYPTGAIAQPSICRCRRARADGRSFRLGTGANADATATVGAGRAVLGERCLCWTIRTRQNTSARWTCTGETATCGSRASRGCSSS
jgi:hypothetical protein